MAHSSIPRVRVVRRYNPDAAWDEGWLRPALAWLKRVRARFAPSWSAMLRRWGGVAGMVGGLLWAALSFVFFLESYEIYDLLGLPRSPDTFFYSIGAEYLVVPLILFIVALLGLYQERSVRASRLGRLGFVLALLGLGLKISIPPLAAWLEHIWLNRPIAGIFGIFNGGWIDTPLSAWYSNAGPSFALLLLGIILLGISCLRTRAFPTIAVLGLTVCTLIMLNPAGLVLRIASVFVELPYIVTYDYLSLLFDYGLFPLIAYLFGISWIGLGYALHCKANQRQSTTQT